MKKLICLSLGILLYSCNDGDIIVTTFNFGNSTLELCNLNDSYVFFKINNNPAESISVKIIAGDTIFDNQNTLIFNLDGTNNFANYRQYDNNITNSYFCSSIPPASPLVTVNYLGSSGRAELTKTIIRNDNDTVDEEIGNLDTDGDGLPNYFDFDDDGDNVPTATEVGLDPANPKDTDGDVLPDYLDDDDDGDGVLTRDEDENGNLNPADDITDPSVGPDYLNPAVAISYNVNHYRRHEYTKVSNISLILRDIVLSNDQEEITQQTLDMGERLNIQTVTDTITPVFPLGTGN